MADYWIITVVQYLALQMVLATYHIHLQNITLSFTGLVHLDKPNWYCFFLGEDSAIGIRVTYAPPPPIYNELTLADLSL